MDWTANYKALMDYEGGAVMSKKQSMAIDFNGQQAPHPWAWQWLVHGSGKAPYRVSVRKFNMADALEWGCTCPASRFLADGERNCKHVLRIQLEMAQNPFSFANVPESVRAMLAKALPLTTLPASGSVFSVLAAPKKTNERRLKVIQ